jgi:DNA-binding transcriptional regulator GbsR (MarR family)
MTTEERIKKQRELVETIGLHFDKQGLQPIAGRIMGLLMVMDKERFSFDEIIEELQISKSSASNALKNLEIRKKIEYITLPGERKRYFQLRRQDRFSLIHDFEEKMLRTIEMFDCIVSLKADKESSNAIFLNEMSELTRFILEQLHNFTPQANE